MIPAERIEALEAAATSWVGTPFCEGTPVKGAGVSCHHLVAELFFESGLMVRQPIPNGPSNWRAQHRSLIAEWVEASGLFLVVGGPAHVGDLLGFRVGALHHAMIQLCGGRIVHSVARRGVEIAPQIPASWSCRLAVIWRFKEFA